MVIRVKVFRVRVGIIRARPRAMRVTVCDVWFRVVRTSAVSRFRAVRVMVRRASAIV